MQGIEAELIVGFQAIILQHPVRIAFAVFCARWLILAFVPIIFLYAVRPKSIERHAAMEAIWAGIVSVVATTVMAFFVHRARPFVAHANDVISVLRLIPHPFNTSFPSGHTALTISVASALFFANRRLGIVAALIAVCVALGRMAVGVHYPSDIFGGILVGLVSFALVRVMHRQIRRKDIAESVKRHHH